MFTICFEHEYVSFHQQLHPSFENICVRICSIVLFWILKTNYSADVNFHYEMLKTNTLIKKFYMTIIFADSKKFMTFRPEQNFSYVY